MYRLVFEWLARKVVQAKGKQRKHCDAYPVVMHWVVFTEAPKLPVASVLLGEPLQQLRRDAEHGHKNVLDNYGATNPAEFFAVATECFFEKPIQLRRKHPQLYEELKAYYRQDPASFVSS